MWEYFNIPNPGDYMDKYYLAYRYIKIDFATGNYSDVIDASNELITLIQNDKVSIYFSISLLGVLEITVREILGYI